MKFKLIFMGEKKHNIELKLEKGMAIEYLLV